MKEEKKNGFFKRIFGRKSSCCSLNFEEIDANEKNHSEHKNSVSSCGCSKPCSEVNTDKDEKK